MTLPVSLDIDVFPPSFALVTHLFSVTFTMIDTPDHTPTKTDAPYGAPLHLKMKPHLTEKQTLPHCEAPFQERIPRKKQI